MYVTDSIVILAAPGTIGLLQITLSGDVVVTSVGVNVIVLVSCPALLLVSVTVNPISVSVVPTGSDANSELPGALKTPVRFVCHLRTVPLVTTHVHVL